MKVLMIGPARSVNGGISAVVNNYYRAGLDKKVDLQYIALYGILFEYETGSNMPSLLFSNFK